MNVGAELKKGVESGPRMTDLEGQESPTVEEGERGGHSGVCRGDWLSETRGVC